MCTGIANSNNASLTCTGSTDTKVNVTDGLFKCDDGYYLNTVGPADMCSRMCARESRSALPFHTSYSLAFCPPRTFITHAHAQAGTHTHACIYDDTRTVTRFRPIEPFLPTQQRAPRSPIVLAQSRAPLRKTRGETWHTVLLHCPVSGSIPPAPRTPV